LFAACTGQWRVIAGMTAIFYQGLDMPSLLAAMDIFATDNKKEMLEQVQLIESGALGVLNEKVE